MSSDEGCVIQVLVEDASRERPLTDAAASELTNTRHSTSSNQNWFCLLEWMNLVWLSNALFYMTREISLVVFAKTSLANWTILITAAIMYFCRTKKNEKTLHFLLAIKCLTLTCFDHDNCDDKCNFLKSWSLNPIIRCEKLNISVAWDVRTGKKY